MENIARITYELLTRTKKLTCTSEDIRIAVIILYPTTNQLCIEGGKILSEFNSSRQNISSYDMGTIRIVRQNFRDELKKYNENMKCSMDASVYLFGVLKKNSTGYIENIAPETQANEIIHVVCVCAEHFRKHKIKQNDIMFACKLLHPNTVFNVYHEANYTGKPTLRELGNIMTSISSKYSVWIKHDRNAIKCWKFITDQLISTK